MNLDELRRLSAKELLELRTQYGNAKGVAKKLGLSERSVQRVYESLSDTLSDDDGDECINELYHKTRCGILERENEKLRHWQSLVTETLLTANATFSPVKPPVLKHNKVNERDEHLCILNISDVHVGELVTEADTGGLTTYDFAQFVERCERYKEHLALIVRDIRDAYPVRNAILNFLGDIATSEGVFPMQLARNDLYLNDQIVKASWYMADIVRYVCSLFENVYVFCVAGNHKPKGLTFDSDAMIYNIMELLLRDQSNLHYRISDSVFCGLRIGPEEPYLDFAGYTEPSYVLLTHGNGVQWNMGVPYYGLDRLVMRFSQVTRTTWDQIFVGHGHTPATAGLWQMGGCWPGGTDFSISKMQAASWPSQPIMFFHPKWGMRLQDKIYLTDRPQLSTPDALGVMTPTNGGVM
jgi:hypothetical protein